MTDRTLLIYKSKTGFTEYYAKLIAEKISCDIISFKDKERICFDDYNTIIFGGGFYAGTINGLKWFKDKLPKLEGKRIIIYATGASPPESPDIHKALRKNFTDKEWESFKVFYLHGGLCYEKMNLLDRILMAIFRKMMKKSEGNSEAYQMIQKSYDCTTKDMILPLEEYYRKEVLIQ